MFIKLCPISKEQHKQLFGDVFLLGFGLHQLLIRQTGS